MLIIELCIFSFLVCFESAGDFEEDKSLFHAVQAVIVDNLQIFISSRNNAQLNEKK